MTTDDDSDASKTNDDRSTSQASSGADTDATGNTSDTSVGSRRSSRIRTRKRHDDSLAEEMELKYHKKSKTGTGKRARKTKVKEVGVKPNAASEASRKVALNDAKRLAALMKQKQKLDSKIVNTPSTSTSNTNLVLGASAQKNSSRSSIDNLEGCETSLGLQTGSGGKSKTPAVIAAFHVGASSSTPKVGEDLTPRKKKLMEENESLRRLLCKNKTQPEEDQLNLSETMFSNDIDNTVIQVVKNAEQRDGGQEEIHNYDGVSVFHMKSVDFVKKDKQKIKKHIDNSVEQRDCEQDEVHDDNNGVADLNMKTVDDVKKDKQKTKKHKSKSKRKRKRHSKKSKKSKRRRHSSSSSTSSTSSSSLTSVTSSASEEERKKKRKRRKRRNKVRSDQLLYNSECSDVEEILKGTGVYMKQGAVAAIKRSARSHTSAARGFLVGVFTTNALKECSLKGNLSKGPLGKTNEARPGLFGPGLDAVLGAARQLAKDRKFEIMKDSVVNHELSTKQSELRSIDRMKAAMKTGADNQDL